MAYFDIAVTVMLLVTIVMCVAAMAALVWVMVSTRLAERRVERLCGYPKRGW